MEDVHAGGGEEQPPHGMDKFHEVQRQVIEAFDRGDALHGEATDERHLDAKSDTTPDTTDGLEGLYTEATTLVYSGSKMSVVLVTIIIMNMCSMFRVDNTFTNALFDFLSGGLLPKANKLPKNHYATSKNIRKLGFTTKTSIFSPMDVLFMTKSMHHLIYVRSAHSHIGWMAPTIYQQR